MAVNVVTVRQGFPKLSEDDKGSRTYDVDYQITNATGIIAVNAALPQRGEFYGQTNRINSEIDRRAILKTKNVTRNPESQGTYYASCQFSTKNDDKDCTENQDDNPLNESWTLDWLFGIEQITFERDMDGVAIVNSADEVFDPPLEKPDYHLQAVIKRNVFRWDPLTAKQYLNTINEDSFSLGANPSTMFPPMTAHIIEWSASRRYYGTCLGYFETTMRIGFKETEQVANVAGVPQTVSGWNRIILDASFTTRPANGKRNGILDDKMRPLNAQVLLDGQGNELAKNADPFFHSFRQYKQIKYSGLFRSPRWQA